MSFRMGILGLQSLKSKRSRDIFGGGSPRISHSLPAGRSQERPQPIPGIAPGEAFEVGQPLGGKVGHQGGVATRVGVRRMEVGQPEGELRRHDERGKIVRAPGQAHVAALPVQRVRRDVRGLLRVDEFPDEVEADDAAARREGVAEPVGQVAHVVVDGPEIAVAGEDGQVQALGVDQGQHVPCEGVARVRKVDGDPAAAQVAQQRRPVRLEADLREVAAAEAVLAVVGQRDVERAADARDPVLQALQAIRQRFVLRDEAGRVFDGGQGEDVRMLEDLHQAGAGREVLEASAGCRDRLVERELLGAGMDAVGICQGKKRHHLQPHAARAQVGERAPDGVDVVEGAARRDRQVGQQVAVQIKNRVVHAPS